MNMARENRAANRAAAKETAEKTGYELDEMLEPIEEEDEDDLFSSVNEEDASESESVEEATPSDVNKGEEEVKEAEVETAEVEAEATEKVGEEAEKKVEEAKTEEVKTEPTVAAPTQEDEDKPLSDEQATKLFTEWRSTTEDILAEHHYKLSEEDVAQLNDNPAVIIPRMMARVYLDTISASFQQFVNYMPNMVFQVLEQREKSLKDEEQFFNTWKELKDHRKEVFRLGKAYRSANPGATLEEFINEVGAQAMVALRLVPEKKNGNDKATPQKPFKPVTKTGAEAPVRPKDDNPFANLVREFQDIEEIDEN